MFGFFPRDVVSCYLVEIIIVTKLVIQLENVGIVLVLLPKGSARVVRPPRSIYPVLRMYRAVEIHVASL